MNNKSKIRKPPIPPARISDSNDKYKAETSKPNYSKMTYICPKCGRRTEYWIDRNSKQLNIEISCSCDTDKK